MTPGDLDTPLDANSLARRLLHRLQHRRRDRRQDVHRPVRAAGRAVSGASRAADDAVPRRHALARAAAACRRAGTATEKDFDLVLDVCDRIIGKCLCVLGDSAAIPWPLRDEVPRRVPRAPRARRLPFGADSSLDDLFAPSTSTRRGGARVSAELVTVTVDEREIQVPKGTRHRRDGARGGIEIPVFCYERGSARPSARAACAWSRWKECRSCSRLHAHRAGRR